MRKNVLALLLMMIASMPLQAQRKQIGDARTILKSGKNYDQAEKLMTNLLKDSANQENRRIYEIWLQSVQKQFEQANERLYMKKQQDTAQFFQLVRRMFPIAFRLDSLDARPDRKGRVQPELRRENSQLMDGHRPNLYFGGAYFFRKGDYKKAFDYFEAYVDCSRQPLFEDYHYDSLDRRLPEAAYWCVSSGYRMNDPVLTLRHHRQALRDTSRAEACLQYAAEAWLQLRDDSMYVATLRKGFERYPTSRYFFPRLMDSQTKRGKYDEALQIVNRALESNGSDPLLLFAKSSVLLSMEQYEESLQYSDLLIAQNDSMPDAYWNAGTALLNTVLSKNARRDKKEIRKIYQRARTYMEQYRLLAPDQQQKWAPALYRIYLNLNMGKQFDEMDKILKKLKK